MDIRGLLRSPLAPLYLRPAFDRLAVPVIAGWYFPLSRAWAAARAADGDPDKLMEALPALSRRPRAAARALARLTPRIERHQRTADRWEAALFGPKEEDPKALAALESARQGAAQAMMLGRLYFLGLHLADRFPPIAWDLAGPAAVARRHGARRADPARAFEMREPGAAFELSRPIPQGEIETQWLRGPAMAGGKPDTLWARIERPRGRGPHPALVFTHGICMETEFWREEDGPAERLAAEGIAVVRPEGPFHGRRTREGFFGGEPVFAFGPLGLLDYFEAHVRELGRL
ncbi:MAG TPA: hypothetical protein VLN73_09120, partial [Alphaproteobacteria bacterium]|nr:hypothetical protein [Alphaproteobacteria bacterium]